ncbi:MAG: hypothetical protein AB9897_05395 [Anaerolineaceae bacterium]
MENSSGTQLLPIGETIDFCDQKLRILKYLSSGYTSVVYLGELDSSQYRGPQRVAIKVIKQDLGEDGLKIFQGEVSVLEQLMNFEKEEDPITESQLKIAPIYYGTDVYHGCRYIVMEFIQGSEINDLLIEKHRLSEEQASKIAWQLFQFLGILHDKVKKTIFDFKEENFWWSEENGGQLRVIDLGGLPDIRSDALYLGNPRLDLLKTSVFIYKLLTGKSIFVPLSQEIEDVRPVLDKSDLSWGCKEIFGRCLNPNPEFRFNSAQDAKVNFFDLYDFWRLPDTELISASEANLNAYTANVDQKSQESKEQAIRARLAIGIVENRNPQLSSEAESLLKRTDQAVEATSNYRAGVDLFKGGSYDAAYSQFKMGLAFGNDKKKYRNWMLLASIGKEVPTSSFSDAIKSQLMESVELMISGQYPAAKTRLVEISSKLTAHGLNALVGECSIFINLAQAREHSRHGEFTESIQLIRQTLEITRTLPEDSMSILEDVGDLKKFLENEEGLAKTRGEASIKQNEAQESLEKKEYSTAVSLLRRSWENYPVTEFHSEIFLSVLKQLIAANELNAAGILASLMETMPDKTKDIQDGIDEIKAWIRAQHFYKQGDIQGFIASIVQLKQLWLNEPNSLPGFEKFIKECVDFWIESNDPEKLRIIEPRLKELFPDAEWVKNIAFAIQKIASEKSPELKSAVDTGITQILAHIAVIDPERVVKEIQTVSPYQISRINAQFLVELQKIQPVVQEITQIATSIHYREDELKALEARITRLISETKTVSEKVKNQIGDLAQKETSMETEFASIQELVQSIKLKTGRDQNADGQQSNMGILNRFAILYFDAYHFASIDPDPDGKAANLLMKIASLFDQFGLDGWGSIKSIVDSKISGFESQFKEMTHRFEIGDVQAAAAWIEQTKAYLSTDKRLKELTGKVNLAQDLLSWTQRNEETLQMNIFKPEIIRDIRFYLKNSLPKCYWNNSRIFAYLSKWDQELSFWLQQNHAGISDPEFLEKIKQLLSVRKTLSLLSDPTTNSR